MEVILIVVLVAAVVIAVAAGASSSGSTYAPARYVSRRKSLKEAVAAFDMTRIRRKAMGRHRWTEAQALAAEAQYREFLFLVGKHRGQVIVPWSLDLDLFWHEHILDTMAYARDCQELFGRIIHHDPHIEERPRDYASAKQQTDALRTTPTASSSSCGSTCAIMGGCGSVDQPASHHGSDAGSGHHGGSHDGGGHGGSDGGHGGSDGGHGGGHSCGGHSCGGHSCGGHSCGGSSCGGGGGCGGH